MDCCAQKIIRVASRSAVIGVAVWLLASQADAAPLYRSIDGSGNNIANPGWGAAGTELLRLAAPAYGDGISSLAGAGRPSARAVSNAVSAQSGPTLNSKGATDFLWQWGQFLDHDIDLTHTGAIPAPIPIPTGDPVFDPQGTGVQVMSFTRSEGSGSPRQQANSITAFIDASNVYGSDAATANSLRAFSNGLMKVTASANGDLLPLVNTPQGPMFLAGDVRANEQSALTAMHTLFVREHNRLAGDIAAANPGFTDEQIYQEARKLVGAMIQSVTYNEFLPMILGNGAPGAYTGYDAGVNPGIANEFSTAAYRFGHSMLSETLLRLDENGDVIANGNLPLAQAFFNPSHILDPGNGGIEPILRGLSQQVAQEVDPQVIDAVRNLLFGPPGFGFDLAALNMQRGRDHGLPSYNDLRAIILGVDKFTGWDDPDLNFLPGVKEALMAVYASIDDVDLWAGGLSESHVNDGMMGELFAAIMLDQFERLRVGDRFWYENGLFEQEWMDFILGSSLREIVMRNTGIGSMQVNAFLVSAPESLALFGLGLTILALTRRRREGRLQVLARALPAHVG
ncbi:MAG: peroxiredoxin [Rhodospirillaceae bacterium]|jgi:peroxidase|nr:peroxiredoxin [Rhodospirillaceae bacterium]MBT6426993.1 peroxiredoxin [Rhodospirillaceae bacterium]